jgi:hypothetical protein
MFTVMIPDWYAESYNQNEMIRGQVIEIVRVVIGNILNASVSDYIDDNMVYFQPECPRNKGVKFGMQSSICYDESSSPYVILDFHSIFRNSIIHSEKIILPLIPKGDGLYYEIDTEPLEQMVKLIWEVINVSRILIPIS